MKTPQKRVLRVKTRKRKAVAKKTAESVSIKFEGRRSLRIAQVAPLIERIPPAKYGGTERVVYFLTEELVRRGHKVTLFASGNSITTATLSAVHPVSLREAKIPEMYGLNALALLNVGSAYDRRHEFDVIHDHTDYISLPTAHVSETPVLVTHHGPFTPHDRRLFQTLNHPHIAAISHAQAESAHGLNLAGVVHNGLEMEHYPFSEAHDGYLLFVGRISMQKGTHYAIEVAQYLNLPLIIAAKLDTVDMQYFNEYVGPKLSESIRWIGEVNEEERNKLMSRAMCFLHPITWQEPFGLAMIEAMACGAPVVAFNRGSIPEVVRDGKTGFVVRDLEEMIQAVASIDQIKREDCRIHTLSTFNAKLMTDRYENIYYRLLEMKKEQSAKPAEALSRK